MAANQFSYKIVATEEFCDHAESYHLGDVLCDPDDGDGPFETYRDAVAAAETMLHSVDGGRAFNAAKNSAEIIIVDCE